jgi:hypothetical protein
VVWLLESEDQWLGDGVDPQEIARAVMRVYEGILHGSSRAGEKLGSEWCVLPSLI